jgi:hypothetical protein
VFQFDDGQYARSRNLDSSTASEESPVRLRRFELSFLETLQAALLSSEDLRRRHQPSSDRVSLTNLIHETYSASSHRTKVVSFSSLIAAVPPSTRCHCSELT